MLPRSAIARSGLVSGLVLLGLCAGPPAGAREYSVDIDVADEQELRQMYYDGLLDDEEFDILLKLLETPIDINRAERRDLYMLPGVTLELADKIVDERVLNGPYYVLQDLVTRVDGVTQGLLRRIDTFVYLRIPSAQGIKPPVRGYLDFRAAKEFRATEPIENDYPGRSHDVRQLGYDRWPAFALGGGATVLGWLDLGIAGSAQEGLHSVEYDPHSADIYAAYGTPVFRPNLGFVRVTRPEGEAVVGTFHASYGLGLVMNTLGGRNRHGLYIKRGVEMSADRVRQFDGLIGGGARLLALRGGRVDVDLSAFGSIRNYDIYSAYLKRAGGELLDPTTEDLDAVRLWIDGVRADGMTVPNVLRVALVGGNATVRFNRRTQVGFTGYAALQDRNVLAGVQDQNEFLITQDWPVERNFGTIGINGSIGFGLLQMSGEWGLFLGLRAGNALRFVLEVEPAWGEFVLSLRHYDPTFANPYARSEAALDRYAGMIARNEQGVRLSATVHPGKRIRGQFRMDVNHNAQYDVYDLDLRVALRGDPLEFLRLYGRFQFTDQNLAVQGRQHRYAGDIDPELIGYGGELSEAYLEMIEQDRLEEDVEDPEANDRLPRGIEHAGQRVSLTGGLRLHHQKVGNVDVRYTHTWVDNRKPFLLNGTCGFSDPQQGGRVRASARVHPHKTTTISGSVAYVDTDYHGSRNYGGQHGARSIDGWVQISQKIKDRLTLRLRGGIGRRLTNEPSECDAARGYTTPVTDLIYEPTDYELRWFGDFVFSMRIKF